MGHSDVVMSLETGKEWVTATGAVVAAATGVWNLVRQMRGTRDKFSVGLDTVSPAIYQDNDDACGQQERSPNQAR